MSLVRSGIFDAFDEELFAELPREYVLSNAATQAEALDGSRSLVGHMCAMPLKFLLATAFGCVAPFQTVNGTRMIRWLFSFFTNSEDARRAKATVVAMPKRSRTRLDILTTLAIGHRDVG